MLQAPHNYSAERVRLGRLLIEGLSAANSAVKDFLVLQPIDVFSTMGIDVL